jgi:5-methylcytosine-specific restriction endonuclease McrA
LGTPQKSGRRKDNSLNMGLNIGLDPYKKSEKKRRPIDKNVRHLVWTKYNKSSLSGKCYCCKTPITYQHFHVGHNKAVAKGGKDNINNLRPICSSCNNSMRTMSIEQYKAKYFGSKKPTKKGGRKKPGKKKTQNNDLFGGSIFGKPPRHQKSPFGFKL